MKRILLGGLVGGLIVFVWGAVSHMALPIGTAGIRSLPAERTVVGALEVALDEPGFYVFPYTESEEPTPEEEAEWQRRYREGPTGVLVYHPEGEEPLSARHLGTELLSNVLGALIAAALLASSRLGFAGRVLFVGALGVFAWLAIDVSFWNWYRFPSAMTVAAGIDAAVGWCLAGLALAFLVRPSGQAR